MMSSCRGKAMRATGSIRGGGYPVNLFAYVLIPSDSGVKHLVSFQVKGFASGVEVREREGTSALELGNKIIHRGFFLEGSAEEGGDIGGVGLAGISGF